VVTPGPFLPCSDWPSSTLLLRYPLLYSFSKRFPLLSISPILHTFYQPGTLHLSSARSNPAAAMRTGRYSPVPGSGSDLQIPYYDESASRLPNRGHRTTTFRSISDVTQRRWRPLLIAVTIALGLIYFLLQPTNSKQTLTHINYDAVDWSSFAYSQYATDEAYLCNSVMIFEALDRLGSQADRILFYPQTWDVEVSNLWDRSSQLLIMARDKFKVKLTPVNIPDASNVADAAKAGGGTWDRSVAKLMAFEETQYRRILHIDSDVTLYRNLDDLFLLPSAAVAMPRAYWSDEKPMPLTSLLVLLEPSLKENQALVNASWNVAEGMHKYDMELLNERYHDSALVLPHRPYLITGELRRSDHQAFLGNDYETWDVQKILSDASLVHFSDWPLPKPWIMWPIEAMRSLRPKCRVNPGTAQEGGCEDREAWMRIYDDFRRRRKEICKLLSVPAPKWPPTGVNITST
jgi:hypothetical protein